MMQVRAASGALIVSPHLRRQAWSLLTLDAHGTVALQFKPLQDMTSNQLIVLGQLKQASHAGILPKAVELAKGAAAAFPSVDIIDLTVDFAVS